MVGLVVSSSASVEAVEDCSVGVDVSFIMTVDVNMDVDVGVFVSVSSACVVVAGTDSRVLMVDVES